MSLWGFQNSLKWFPYLILLAVCLLVLPFNKSRTRAMKRIGPHDFDVMCLLVGSLLGDANAEFRVNSTRFNFQQELPAHGAYIVWLHAFLSTRGYCNPNSLVSQTRPGVNGSTRTLMRFSTWSFTSFNFLFHGFYPNGTKMVPRWIGTYLSPLALAVWMMDDGGAVSSGLKFATNSFTYDDCLFLASLLQSKFGLVATVQSAGYPNQYVIYVAKGSMPLLASMVGPYMHPSMYYKLNGHM